MTKLTDKEIRWICKVVGIETLWGECKEGSTFGEDIQGYWGIP